MTARRLCLLALLSWAPATRGVPPLIIGDTPTADPGTAELYAGVERVKSGGVELAVPATELVLGISTWQEVTLEVPYLAVEDHRGLGDVVLGTKLLLLPEGPGRPGLAGSVEWKLPNGDRAAGLGTGASEVAMLLRVQQTWDRATLIANAGYALVGEPRIDGVRQPRRNTGFLGVGGSAALHGPLSALADLYWRSADVPGEPARAAFDLGLQLRAGGHLAVHGAVGSSLRSGALGGPQLRVYVGLKGEFPVF